MIYYNILNLYLYLETVYRKSSFVLIHISIYRITLYFISSSQLFAVYTYPVIYPPMLTPTNLTAVKGIK